MTSYCKLVPAGSHSLGTNCSLLSKSKTHLRAHLLQLRVTCLWDVRFNLLAELEVAMNRSALILSIALTSSCAIASDKHSQPSDASGGSLRAQGKKIFVSRCAQCHDNDANKKLPDGTTLLQRLAKTTNLEGRLQTRLKMPEESHAVALYIEDLLKGSQTAA